MPGKLSNIAPDDDEQNVMERGGPGIDRDLVLGDNVFGTEKLTLRAGQKIIRVTAGKHQSYRTAVRHATIELAILLGCTNDVGDQQPALFPNGTRRPAMPLQSLAESHPFFDNIIMIDECSISSSC
jgi:hypothetical protein